MGEPAKALSPDELYAEWSTSATTPQTDEQLATRHAQTRVVAAAVLSLKTGQCIGGLTVADASWNGDALGRARGLAPGSPEWDKAMGPHADATLTEDGRGAIRTAWCTCDFAAVAETDWVRYEAWDRDGVYCHGFVHRICRRLLQTG